MSSLLLFCFTTIAIWLVLATNGQYIFDVDVADKEEFCSEPALDGIYFDGLFYKMVRLVERSHNNPNVTFSLVAKFYKFNFSTINREIMLATVGYQTLFYAYPMIVFSGFYLPFAKITVELYHVDYAVYSEVRHYWAVWYDIPNFELRNENSDKYRDTNKYYLHPQSEFHLCSSNVKHFRCCYGSVRCQPNRLFDLNEQNTPIGVRYRAYFYHPVQQVLMHVTTNLTGNCYHIKYVENLNNFHKNYSQQWRENTVWPFQSNIHDTNQAKIDIIVGFIYLDSGVTYAVVERGRNGAKRGQFFFKTIVGNVVELKFNTVTPEISALKFFGCNLGKDDKITENEDIDDIMRKYGKTSLPLLKMLAVSNQEESLRKDRRLLITVLAVVGIFILVAMVTYRIQSSRRAAKPGTVAMAQQLRRKFKRQNKQHKTRRQTPGINQDLDDNLDDNIESQTTTKTIDSNIIDQESTTTESRTKNKNKSAKNKKVKAKKKKNKLKKNLSR